MLGEAIARRGLDLVYGGARVGLMGSLADAALAVGGSVTGIMPKAIVDMGVAHPNLTHLHVVGSMHERKRMMVDLSDGFIAMPGGYGTLDEFFEIVTWTQLGFLAKPCGMLNTCGYFDALLGFLDVSVMEGFVKPQHRSMLIVEESTDIILDRLASYVPPRVEKLKD
jgi:uncharacterized protein (TIGR00730 family)